MKTTIIVVAFVASIIVLYLGLSGLQYVADKSSCETWGEGTQREVKFISNYPWYFDCLVKTESGWISASHLYQQEIPNINL